MATIEISFKEPRRANRNSQGPQRSWTQGAEEKMTERSQTTSYPTIERPINQSIDRLINESTLSQVKTSNKKQIGNKHIRTYWQTEAIKQATRYTIVNSTIQKYRNKTGNKKH